MPRMVNVSLRATHPKPRHPGAHPNRSPPLLRRALARSETECDPLLACPRSDRLREHSGKSLRPQVAPHIPSRRSKVSAAGGCVLQRFVSLRFSGKPFVRLVRARSRYSTELRRPPPRKRSLRSPLFANLWQLVPYLQRSSGNQTNVADTERAAT